MNILEWKPTNELLDESSTDGHWRIIERVDPGNQRFVIFHRPFAHLGQWKVFKTAAEYIGAIDATERWAKAFKETYDV